MSAQLFTADVVFFQRLLKAMGLFNGKADGIWNTKLDAAQDDFFAKGAALAEGIGRFDPRSEGNISTLHLSAQKAARDYLKAVRGAGFDARIISGTRTYEEQNVLFRKGRFGNPPPVVTNARGGQSNHNFGIAWDIGLFQNGRYLPGDTKAEIKLYEEAAALRDTAALEWGGDWVTFKDRPHYQLKDMGKVSELAAKFENGTAFG